METAGLRVKQALPQLVTCFREILPLRNLGVEPEPDSIADPILDLQPQPRLLEREEDPGRFLLPVCKLELRKLGQPPVAPNMDGN